MRIASGRKILVYEDIIKAAQPFVFSQAPANVADVCRPIRRLVRYDEAKKALIADYMAKTRQVEATIKAQKRMAKLAKLSKATNPSGASEQTTPPAIDHQELRSIINTFMPYVENYHEEDELSLLTRLYLEKDPQGVASFKQFTKMLRSRKR